MTFSDIAIAVNAKRGVVQMRYNKMVKRGIIKGSTLALDYSKIGFPYSAGLEIKVVDSKIEEFDRYIGGLKIEDTLIVKFKTLGRFNMLAVMDARNLIDVHKFKEMIKQHPAVLEVRISVMRAFYYNYDSLNLQLLKENKPIGQNRP